METPHLSALCHTDIIDSNPFIHLVYLTIFVLLYRLEKPHLKYENGPFVMLIFYSCQNVR